ncbi:acyl-CoA N-acyltransferase [Hyaloraphidium curvatum]|nr:acyl-CoA N-acyltransferase [Hyaloraphidium curvatum]
MTSLSPRRPLEPRGQRSSLFAPPSPVRRLGLPSSPPGPAAPQPAPTRLAPPLPPNLAPHPVDADTVAALRALNARLLPVSYNDRFYAELLGCHPPELSRVVLDAAGNAVAALCARLEWDYPVVPGEGKRAMFPPHPNARPRGPLRVYLMTIGVDPTMRGAGIGTALLEGMLEQAAKWKDAGVGRVVLHVWTKNEEAVGWYLKRGFSKVALESGYYSRNRGVEPPDAWLLEHPLGGKPAPECGPRELRTDEDEEST